jgi:hypothetical protein
VVCIDTSRPKWSFWTSHPWARPTDMSSKSSRSSNKRRDNLGLGTPHSKSQERAGPNPQKKGQRKDGQPQDNQSKPQAKKDTRKTKKDIRKWCDFHKSPWHNTVDFRSKKSMVAEVKASESDAVLTLSQNQKGGDGSLTQNPVLPLLPPSSSPVNQTSQRKASTFFIHRCG